VSVDVKRLRELEAKATPGPWELRRDDDEGGYITYDIGVGGLTIARVPEDTRDDDEIKMAAHDARLVADMRNALPALLDELESLRFRLSIAESLLAVVK
jgi:hypothetical protein